MQAARPPAPFGSSFSCFVPLLGFPLPDHTPGGVRITIEKQQGINAKVSSELIGAGSHVERPTFGPAPNDQWGKHQTPRLHKPTDGRSDGLRLCVAGLQAGLQAGLDPATGSA